MKSILLLLSFYQACYGAALLNSDACGDYFCADILAPVCGSNGKTYGNHCYLSLAKCSTPSLTVSHTGVCAGYTGPLSPGKRLISPCPPKACFLIYMPVCGSDGITYGNSCELKANNCTGHIITEAHSGPC